MSVPRTLLATALAAAALATPAAADPTVGTDLVYTVTASDPSGSLTASCVFRPDRWTADYGPTYVDAVAVATGIVQHTEVTCRVYTWGSLSGEVAATSPTNVAGTVNARTGTVGHAPNVVVCVEASTQYVVDHGVTVSRCA